VEYVSLNDDGSAAARRFHERVRNPLLTDISIDWNGLQVADVYPQRIPDLFGAKPVVLTGRYASPGRATIRLQGKIAGNDFKRDIPVELPETMASHDVLASLWARARIDSLMAQDYAGAQDGAMRDNLKDTITQLGIEYRLMTQFTSFVAVEEMIVTDGGQPRRIDVPVEVPQGMNQTPDVLRVSYGVLSLSSNIGYPSSAKGKQAPMPIQRRARSGSGGTGSGRGGNVGGGGAGGAGGGGAVPSPTPTASAFVLGSVNADPAAPLIDSSVSAIGVGRDVRRKLHSSLLAVVEQLKNKQPLTTGEQHKFIRDGKAEVQIWLTDKSAETLAKLNELGFEVVLDPKTAKLVIGRVPIQKLEALVALEFVRYVSPQTFK
jgi:hypothetical protein